MAERRKNKKKKETEAKDVDKKPSKEEYNVAKYLKKNLPEKKTTLLGHKVEYFIACKAVDCLIESPWAKENKKGELNFSNRDIAIDFMAKLLDHKFFHRAKKIVVTKELKKRKKETAEPAPEPPKEKESKKSKSKSDTSEKTDEKDTKKAKSEDKEAKKAKSDEKDGKKAKSDEKDGKKAKPDDKDVKKSDEKEVKKETSEVPEKKKEKKKIKLDMHLDQCFIDSNEPYVWIYDPIPLRTWVTGALMVIAAVLLCLFPLWPQSIRHYIYYLSVAAAFFLIFIIGLAVLRLVVFVLVWILTLGKHHLWLLPNLTEDVGFFESFWPLYKYEYKGNTTDDTKKKDKKGKGKKDSDGDKEGDSANDDKRDQSDSDEKKEEGAECRENGEESESGEERTDSEQKRSDEDDEEEEEPKTENGFEFLEAEEVSEEEDRKTK